MKKFCFFLLSLLSLLFLSSSYRVLPTPSLSINKFPSKLSLQIDSTQIENGKISPLNNNILIKKTDPEASKAKKSSLFILPEDENEEKLNYGQIVSQSSDSLLEENLFVFYKENHLGTELKIDDEPHCLIHQNDVILTSTQPDLSLSSIQLLNNYLLIQTQKDKEAEENHEVVTQSGLLLSSSSSSSSSSSLYHSNFYNDDTDDRKDSYGQIIKKNDQFSYKKNGKALEKEEEARLKQSFDSLSLSDYVQFRPYGGLSVKIQEKLYLLLPVDQVLAKWKPLDNK